MATKIEKDALLKQFNRLASEFMGKLIETYPHDSKELRIVHKCVLLSFKANKSLLIKKFHDFMETDDTRAMITTHQDKFFEQRASQLLIFKGIDMTHNWSLTPQDTKNAIWSYLEILSTLSASYVTSCGVLDSNNDSVAESDVNMDAINIDDIAATLGLDVSQMHQLQDVITSDLQNNPASSFAEYQRRISEKLNIDCSSIAEEDVGNVVSNIQSIPWEQLGLPTDMNMPQLIQQIMSQLMVCKD